MSVLSSLILIVYPTLLVFLVAFFIGNAYLLSAMFIAYWLMFLSLEQRRYRLDFRMRGVSATFWNYVVHLPFSVNGRLFQKSSKIEKAASQKK